MESGTDAVKEKINISKIDNPEKKQEVNLIFIKVLLSTFIELSSFLDFYSDLLVIWALSQSTDTAWFTISIFTVLAPFYTIYTSLINYNIKLVRL